VNNGEVSATTSPPLTDAQLDDRYTAVSGQVLLAAAPA
jgi:hypothetical protein